MDRLLDLLFVSSLKGVGKKTAYRKYLPAITMSSDTQDLIENYIPKIKAFPAAELDAAMEKAKGILDDIQNAPKTQAISILSTNYPAKLRSLNDAAPLVLYVKGSLNALTNDSIAIVGTRKPSAHSAKVEKNLVSKIIELNPDRTIISGLAFGCDEIAHRTALLNKGLTTACLSSGVQNIVPTQNAGLAEEIVASGGCLVSEYDVHAPATRWSFVERDGLIAALADTTVVVECGENSGTMHTVRKAAELHKPIACYWPVDFTKGTYDGNVYMIERMNAVPLRGTEELVGMLKSK